MKIIVFENENRDKFYPLSQTKAIWELKSGIYSFLERLELIVSEKKDMSADDIYYFTDETIGDSIKELNNSININDYSVFDCKDEFIFINSSLFIDNNSFDFPCDILFKKEENNLLLRMEHSGNKIPDNNIIDYINIHSIEESETKLNFAEYIWDLVHLNCENIEKDFKLASNLYEKNYIDEKDVTIVGESGKLFIEKDVRIDPFVVFDLSGGSVYIAEGAEIHPFTRIEGPAYIGENSIILGAKIREGTSIGEMCRIGGEIEESIFHSYSNKYHDGFIGHAYVGEWVNMGAGTTNSDLKNSYSNVKVSLPFGRVDSKSNKVGSFIGDFAKASIGTLMNTGSVVGTGVMLVFNGKITPPIVENFRWFINSEIDNREWFDSFIISTEKMMGRRDKKLNSKMKILLNKLYKER